MAHNEQQDNIRKFMNPICSSQPLFFCVQVYASSFVWNGPFNAIVEMVSFEGFFLVLNLRPRDSKFHFFFLKIITT